LLNAELVNPARGAHPDFNRILLKVSVLGLTGIGGQRNGLIADALRLIGRLRFCDSPASSLTTIAISN